MKKNKAVHTTVDEDMRSRLEAKLIEQVLNFKVA